MNFEKRMRAIANRLPVMARSFIPGEFIDWLIDLGKLADKLNQEKQT